MKLRELTQKLNTLLDVENWKQRDSSQNGLQVGHWDQEIQHVAFAVDACRESFEQAVKRGAQALVVHHGLFWGKPFTLTDTFYERISYLIYNKLALLAYHLPLDAHPELGNNAQLARHFNLKNIEPFGQYKGATIGFKGELEHPLEFQTWLDTAFMNQRDNLLSILAFGPRVVQKIGIISGGAPWEIQQAIEQGLDVYLTGDAQHSIYHTAQEAKIHLISAGHYFTETWGVYALSQFIHQEWQLTTSFLDIPTGL